METILVFYIIGIFLCASLGVFLAILILRDLKVIISRVISAEKAGFVTSTIKFLFIITALVGGLSFKFYSCDYRYDELIDNPAALTLKVAGQLEGAMHYLLIFLLIFLSLYMIVSILSRNIKRDIKT
jgi:hypothetical protein